MADTRNSTTAGLEDATDTSGQYWFGRWQTATQMQQSLEQARYGILRQYGQLAAQLRNAGKLLTEDAEAYRREDSAVGGDLARAAGWEQVAQRHADGGGGSAGQYVDSVEIPYVTQVETGDGYPADWIADQIEKVRQDAPWFRLSSAGRAFEATAERLTNLADRIKAHALTLEAEWASETSARCQQALQRIAGTAEHVGEVSGKISDYSFRSAETLQTIVSGFPTLDRSTGERIMDTINIVKNHNEESRENSVRDEFKKLNQAYQDVNLTTLPGQVAALLPELSDRQEVGGPPPPPPPLLPELPPQPAAPAASTGPVSAGPGGVSGTQGFVGTPAGLAPGGSDIALPGDQAGSGAVPEIGNPGAGGPSGGLAGAAPAPGAPGGVGTGGGLGGLGPGGVTPGAPAAPGASVGPGGISGVGPGAFAPGGGAAGASPGRGAASTGGVGAGGRPGTPGIAPMTGGSQNSGAAGGRSGAAGGGAGRPGLAGSAGTGASGTGTAGGRPGMGMAPMSGGSPGQGSQSGRTGASGGRAGTSMAPMAGRNADDEAEQARTNWLNEDENPWYGEDEGIPPPVIK